MQLEARAITAASVMLRQPLGACDAARTRGVIGGHARGRGASHGSTSRIERALSVSPLPSSCRAQEEKPQGTHVRLTLVRPLQLEARAITAASVMLPQSLGACNAARTRGVIGGHARGGGTSHGAPAAWSELSACPPSRLHAARKRRSPRGLTPEDSPGTHERSMLTVLAGTLSRSAFDEGLNVVILVPALCQRRG